jgi:enoyl-CoA hydratase/carnithine racemase
VRRVDALPKPTVAVVHACIGGGVAPVAATWSRARNAFFSLPEVARLRAGAAHSFFLRAIDPRGLRRYLLSRALQRRGGDVTGLVHELCEVAADRLGVADDELLLAGPNAVAQAKRLFLRFARAAVARASAELQGEFEQGFTSPEAADGRASFAKRKPRWVAPKQDR